MAIEINIERMDWLHIIIQYNRYIDLISDCIAWP